MEQAAVEEVERPRKPRLNPSLDLDSLRSNVVLLQGDPQSGGHKLFLISEGSGSASCYLHLPDLTSNAIVYGLDSPFLHRTDEYECSFEMVCSIFVRAIRSIQPHGPYLVGGWSIGGMFAYETARQLIEGGDVVQGLLLIDSACPRKMNSPLEQLTMEMIQQAGIYDAMSMSMGSVYQSRKHQGLSLTLGQKQHVLGCIKAVADHDPISLRVKDRPANVFVIWSRFGMYDQLSMKVEQVGALMGMMAEKPGPEKDRSTGVSLDWLTAERTEFGPKGWDRLVGPPVECFPVNGNHFSIMMLPKVKSHTGPLLQKLVRRLVQSPSGASDALDDSWSLLRARDVFREIRCSDLHLKLAKEEEYEDFWTRVYPRQCKLVLAYTAEGFARLGHPVDEMEAGEILPRPAGIPNKHDLLLGVLSDILVDDGLFERRRDEQLARASQPVDPRPSATFHEPLRRDFPRHTASHQLLQVTGSRLAECLRGDDDPMRLMFGLNRQLVQEYYTNAPAFKSASRYLSEYLRRTFDGVQERIELLEVGAGLGGTTAYVLEMLVQLGVRFRHVYTDISPSLVTAAKKRFARLVPEGSSMEFVALDVTKPIPGDMVGSFHAVLSTNCVHAKPNLAVSTGNIRQMLRPKGFLALVEQMQRQYWFDLVFGFLEGWWLFNDGRNHSLAGVDFWQESLVKARFEEVAWVDEDGEDREGKTDSKLIVAFKG